MHKCTPVLIFLWLFALATFVACGGTHGVSDDEYDVYVYGLMTDSRDGQVYKTVKIGSQIWMAENLNYELPESFCHEENPNSCIKYGRLYKWDLQWMRALMAGYTTAMVAMIMDFRHSRQEQCLSIRMELAIRVKGSEFIFGVQPDTIKMMRLV